MGGIKDTLQLVGEALKAAGANEDAKAAGAELGKAALTITKAINIGLLPLAAVNYGFDRAQVYFSERFARDITEKLADVPPEHLIEPKASIAGPALQGLAFAHEEPDLKELYLSLLASAMDDRVSSTVHPAFVEILRQLTSEEAKYLRVLLGVTVHPLVEVRSRDVPSIGLTSLYRHLSPIGTGDPQFPTFVDNWARLGLFEVSYDERVYGETVYEFAESCAEFVALRKEYENDKTEIILKEGMMSRTVLGAHFAGAVGIPSFRPPLQPEAQSPDPPAGN